MNTATKLMARFPQTTEGLDTGNLPCPCTDTATHLPKRLWFLKPGR